MTAYYPVYLDLRGRRCVVVGGGAVALEKVEGLLAAGAVVRVIAPRLAPELGRLADRGSIEHWPRTYQDGDLEGALIAFSERLGDVVHRALAAEADRLAVPLNVQDETAYCSFIAAALVRQGDLTIAISTSGKAPALAVRLKEAMKARYGPHYARFLELSGRLRAPLKARHPDFETRRELWYRLVDSDVLDLLERGDDDGAEERMAGIMGVPREDFALASVEAAS
ncbi:MAG: bifunctional precorrin-2 dehydrogenase/sirohydrochlorin ferrochelatase [Thermoanaerobaculia bacterium]